MLRPCLGCFGLLNNCLSCFGIRQDSKNICLSLFHMYHSFTAQLWTHAFFIDLVGTLLQMPLHDVCSFFCLLFSNKLRLAWGASSRPRAVSAHSGMDCDFCLPTLLLDRIVGIDIFGTTGLSQSLACIDMLTSILSWAQALSVYIGVGGQPTNWCNTKHVSIGLQTQALLYHTTFYQCRELQRLARWPS